eukprot:TRINITY_DN8924_c0_g2_i1.p1 TRINITY_DN8924_c0_g2~~TRINITY_DN8924_c0_g2_i1.p1  ORF type:complete len:789 (+),score=128.54 TRINITY_DN8924_c0_g2_i1:302-2368(+)
MALLLNRTHLLTATGVNLTNITQQYALQIVRGMHNLNLNTSIAAVRFPKWINSMYASIDNMNSSIHSQVSYSGRRISLAVADYPQSYIQPIASALSIRQSTLMQQIEALDLDLQTFATDNDNRLVGLTDIVDALQQQQAIFSTRLQEQTTDLTLAVEALQKKMAAQISGAELELNSTVFALEALITSDQSSIKNEVLGSKSQLASANETQDNLLSAVRSDTKGTYERLDTNLTGILSGTDSEIARINATLPELLDSVQHTIQLSMNGREDVSQQSNVGWHLCRLGPGPMLPLSMAIQSFIDRPSMWFLPNQSIPRLQHTDRISVGTSSSNPSCLRFKASVNATRTHVVNVLDFAADLRPLIGAVYKDAAPISPQLHELQQSVLDMSNSAVTMSRALDDLNRSAVDLSSFQPANRTMASPLLQNSPQKLLALALISAVLLITTCLSLCLLSGGHHYPRDPSAVHTEEIPLELQSSSPVRRPDKRPSTSPSIGSTAWKDAFSDIDEEQYSNMEGFQTTTPQPVEVDNIGNAIYESKQTDGLDSDSDDSIIYGFHPDLYENPFEESFQKRLSLVSLPGSDTQRSTPARRHTASVLPSTSSTASPRPSLPTSVGSRASLFESLSASNGSHVLAQMKAARPSAPAMLETGYADVGEDDEFLQGEYAEVFDEDAVYEDADIIQGYFDVDIHDES